MEQELKNKTVEILKNLSEKYNISIEITNGRVVPYCSNSVPSNECPEFKCWIYADKFDKETINHNDEAMDYCFMFYHSLEDKICYWPDIIIPEPNDTYEVNPSFSDKKMLSVNLDSDDLSNQLDDIFKTCITNMHQAKIKLSKKILKKKIKCICKEKDVNNV